MRLSNRFGLAAAAAVLGLSAAGARGGTLTTIPIETDADTGISPAKTYTHLLDFGTSAAATINGVAFTKAGPDGAGYTYAVSSGTRDNHGGNPNTGASGTGVSALLTDMIYNGGNSPGGTATLTLTGLTPGVQYDTRLYYRQWGVSDRTSSIAFDGDNQANQVTTINEDAVNDAFALSYKFTADTTSVSITFTEANNNQSWHIYGVTNEAVPEPGTIGLAGVVVGGTLLRRRRQRHGL